MSIPLENVPRRFVRREGQLWVVPLLALGPDERPFTAALVAAVAVAERCRGRTRRAIGSDPLEPLFDQRLGGYRAGRAVWACLMETYGFAQPPLGAALGPGVAAALAARGVTGPAALRRALYVQLGAGDGFVAPERRAAALTELAAQHGITAPLEGVDAALWLDAPVEAVLEREADPPSPPWLLARYRRRVLEALLFHATELRLRLPTGAGWRAAYRLAKALRLAVEPEAGGWITLAPWATAVPERGVGARLADAALSLIIRHGARGRATLHLNSRDYLLALDDAVGTALPRSEDPAPSYDSAVEEQLARDLVQLGVSRRGWEVEREPSALVAGDTVVLPDFLCRRGDLEVYLEVAGFWTDTYRERKLAKLRALADALPGLRLALAVDASLPGFDTLPFPALAYRGEVDAAALLRFLEQHFDDLEGRTERARRQLAAAITQQSGVDWLLSPDAAMAAAGCYSLEELARVLDGWTLPAGAVWTPGVGLHGAGFLTTVRTLLDEMVGPEGAPLDAVAAVLRERAGFAGDVAALTAAAGGYRMDWTDLLTARVVPMNGRISGT